jgi:hypothetical protein
MITTAATMPMTSRPANPSAITMNILFGLPPAGATSDMLLSPFSQNVIRSIYCHCERFAQSRVAYSLPEKLLPSARVELSLAILSLRHDVNTSHDDARNN